jgi:hypothetical protein
MNQYPAANDLDLVQSIDRLMRVLRKVGVERIADEPTGLAEGFPRTFFVDSGSSRASASNSGLEPLYPFATVDQALNAAEANRGDVIYVAAGHTQTYTTTTAWSKAGVSVIGLGRGIDRPTFIIGDAVGEQLTISGASMMVKNLIFICGTDAQTIMVQIGATDVRVEGCEFREVLTTKQPLTCLDIGTGLAANVCDRAQVYNCYFHVPTAGDGDRAIELGEVADRVEIVGCVAFGDWDDACIHNVTGKVLTNLLISDCLLTNKLTGQHSIELVSACTGNLVRNMYQNDMAQATGADTGACWSFQCFHCDLVDLSAVPCPVIT